MTILDLKALLGAAIKSQRSALGVSQEELSYRAGLHRTYISDMERGTRNPSVESIEKIAHALEVSVSMLFEQANKGSDARQLVEILLVEDNPQDIRLTLRGFEKAKIANPVHVVCDGAEALDFIFAIGPYAHRRNVRPPQIVLFDLNLAKKTGIDLMQRLKADKTTRDISVIGLTASNRGRSIAECRRLGAVTCIAKPIEFHKLSEVTSRLRLAWALVKPGPAPGSE